jgi:putative hydrolase of the HAD superfamily
MTYSTLFFDLDDTLYDPRNGLWEAIRRRMSLFMAERLEIPPETIPSLRRQYFEQYGTTLRGLQIHYHVDSDEYLDFVHDLPLDQFLQPRPELRQMLLSLPQRRWIFTNADDRHALRVLKQLDLEGCFEGIIDVRAIRFACKPEPEAYQRALALAGDPASQECVMLDDSERNLSPARHIGFTTILVSPNGKLAAALAQASLDGGPSYILKDLLELPRVMPELWGSGAVMSSVDQPG